MLYNYYLLFMISETIADWSKLNSAAPTKMFTFSDGLHANDSSMLAWHLCVTHAAAYCTIT